MIEKLKLLFLLWKLYLLIYLSFSGAVQIEVDQEAITNNSPSTPTSQNHEASDAEDDISVGDNRSETSTPKKGYAFETDDYQKKKNERSSSEYLNNRINTDYNSPFNEDENEFENRNEDRIKLYDSGIFHIYRPDRERNKDDASENSSAFAQMAGSISESIYGRSMDLTKNSFQSQLLAGFAASVMAGSSQRDQDSAGMYHTPFRMVHFDKDTHDLVLLYSLVVQTNSHQVALALHLKAQVVSRVGAARRLHTLNWHISSVSSAARSTWA